jgi:hypothetical protein
VREARPLIAEPGHGLQSLAMDCRSWTRAEQEMCARVCCNSKTYDDHHGHRECSSGWPTWMDGEKGREHSGWPMRMDGWTEGKGTTVNVHAHGGPRRSCARQAEDDAIPFVKQDANALLARHFSICRVGVRKVVHKLDSATSGHLVNESVPFIRTVIDIV